MKWAFYTPSLSFTSSPILTLLPFLPRGTKIMDCERWSRGSTWERYQDHVIANNRSTVKNKVTVRTGIGYRLEEGWEASEVNQRVSEMARMMEQESEMEWREENWLLNIKPSEFAFWKTVCLEFRIAHFGSTMDSVWLINIYTFCLSPGFPISHADNYV